MTDNKPVGTAQGQDHALRSMVIGPADDAAAQAPEADDPQRRLFQIRPARTPGTRQKVSALIKLRYAWRGYATTPLSQAAPPDRMTLVATDREDATIGTVTIGFGGEQGLLVEELFPEEVARLRQQGRRICEFTKLAIENVPSSKRVLASLFHVAFIYANRIENYNHLLIEVNPRHVAYYRRILGFEVLAPSRMNPRVNAPAVLLSLDFTHTEAQIALFGGHPELGAKERSLYPYAFSITDQEGIVGRLKRGDESPAVTVQRDSTE